MLLKRYGDKLYGELLAELDGLGFKEKVLLKRLEASLEVCVKYVRWLKDFLKANQPESERDEIVFFKEIKPKFKAQVIYFQSLLDIESRKQGDGLAYYGQEIAHQEWFLKMNSSFQQYMRLESTHLDAKYFVRGVYDLKLGPDLSVMDADESFSTSHDGKLAQLLAAEMVIEQLHKNIYLLHHPTEQGVADALEEDYEWTDTKSALVELIYGIVYKGSINKGKASLHGFVRFMEKVFKVELGNFYDTYKTIRQRDQRTLYLDSVRDELIRRMDEKLK